MKLGDAYSQALVTGASSGIGAEIAKVLCEAGVPVLAVARNEERLKEARLEISKNNQTNFTPVVADLRKKTDIQKLLKVCKQNPPIDLLINNAGIGYNKELEKLSDEEINSVIGTNLLGHMLLTRDLLRMRQPDSPLHIVFVTSLAGKIGFGGLSVYSATKFALEGFCEALRLEYQDAPVSFTVLRPGVTDTSFFDKAGMQEFHASVRGTKTLHPPSEVAQELLKKIRARPAAIVVGNDKYFIKLMPFIPFKWRFRVLDVINKF